MMRLWRVFLCVMWLAVFTLSQVEGLAMTGATAFAKASAVRTAFGKASAVRTAFAEASAVKQPPQPPMEGFEPLAEVPPGEQIPAFTLLAVAYAFVWIVLIGYVWSVSRRLQKVEQELARLEGRGA